MPASSPNPGADPAPDCPYTITPERSATLRFPLVTTHDVPGTDPTRSFRVTVALPRSWEEAKRRRHPLVIIPDATLRLGSAIEMSRVLAVTKETRACIVVSHDDPSLAPDDAALEATRLAYIVDWCRDRFRVERGEVTLFAAGRALPCARLMFAGDSCIDRWIVAQPAGPVAPWLAPRRRTRSRGPNIAWTTSVDPGRAALPDAARATIALKVLPEATTEGLVVPAFVHGLRSFWSTGHAYGEELMPLARPLPARLMRTLRPLFRAVRGPLQQHQPVAEGERFIVRSTILDRNFEVFVSLPPVTGAPRGRLPAVVALDGNSTFSNVSEITSRMVGAGEIEPVVVIGVGVPRTEGDMAFGLRRFEELSPPCAAAGFDNPLGRFFEAVFALFGLDVHANFGRAPQFHRFLCDELLPTLRRTLPIDPDRLCLVGHSAAGTYAGFSLAQPDSPFTSHVVLSPGVAISDTWMLAPGGGMSRRELGSTVFVAIGGEERDNRFNGLAGIPLADRYADELRVVSGAPVEFHCLEGETHTTLFPRAFAFALVQLFGQATARIGRTRVERTP